MSERKKHIAVLKEMLEWMNMSSEVIKKDDPFFIVHEHRKKAVKYAISSLETDEAYQLEYEKPEICEDCVSRKAVCEWYCNTTCNMDYCTEPCLEHKELCELPSVTPQEPKTGHWIEHECESVREKGYYRCSVCNHGYQRYVKGIRKSDVPYIDGQEYILWNCDNYCPNCGAKMVESQESEDKTN